MIMRMQGNLTSNYTRVGPYRIHARRTVTKSPETIPVVLVHGLGVSTRYMEPLAAAMSEHYNVFALDMPGFGKSSKPQYVLNIRELGNAVALWAQANGLRQAFFVGHGFGCQVISDLAQHHPESIRAIAFLSPTVDPRKRTLFMQKKLWEVNMILEPFTQMEILFRDYKKCGWKRFWRTFEYSIKDRMEQRLPQIDIPALVLRGRLDPLVSMPWAYDVAELLPKGRLVTVPGQSHTLHYTAPQEVASILDNFINDDVVQRTIENYERFLV
jgi:2-hydroxy-6-oxonona-2,4-dienedioate hydrolase